MKKQLLRLALIPALMSLAFCSCTNSHEDDIILYVPKQVRELTTTGENTKTEITYSHTYDSDGRIKTEGNSAYTARLYYSSENVLDSINLAYSTSATGTADSVRHIFTYAENKINVSQVSFVKDQEPDTIKGAVTLNAQLLPQSYAINNTEERYSYDANSKLTSVEQYQNGALIKTYSYGYSGVKSPYDQVCHYPAWYFVAYKHISPVELITSVTLTENGQPAKPVYDLSSFTLSDSLFITHAFKTYYENAGTRVVTYRQDYQKVVFD